MQPDQLPPPFRVNYVQMQKLFDTQNLATGQSYESLESNLGGINGLLESLFTDPVKGIIQENPTRKFKFGENRLKPPELTPFIKCALKQTKDFCIRILAIAACIMFTLAFFSSDPFDQFVQAMSILVAICAVVIIGALTDYRKEKQFIELFLEQEKQQKKIFMVIRGGQNIHLDHTELQVGDIVVIKPGDNVTVDGILLEGSENVEVDESMITGLSDTIRKQPINRGKDCFLRGGSNVFEGTAKMLVIAVGESTYSSRMQSDEQDHEDEGEIIHDEQSPLSKALETLAKFLVFIGCMSALVMFIVLELYMVREVTQLQQKLISRLTLMKVLSDFIAAFLIIVLSIPEGLPLVVTLSLAFSIARLKQDGVIIRNLHVAQVLGGIDTVCFDKTGTLTYNNLKVCNYHGGGEDLSYVSKKDPMFRILAESIMATNTAFVSDEPVDRKSSSSSSSSNVKSQKNQLEKSNKSNQSRSKSETEEQGEICEWNGNRIDVALMIYLDRSFKRDFVLEYQGELKERVRKTIPMGNVNYHTEVLQIRGDQYRIIIKGRSKDVIEKCSKITIKRPENRDMRVFEPGEFVFQACSDEQFNNDFKELENKATHLYQTQSLKTCSFAYKDIELRDVADADWDQVLYNDDSFTFIGSIAMRDDIRDSAKSLDSALKFGNMDVLILTGDTRVNAVNVAKQLGWVNNDQADNEIQRISEHLVKSSAQVPTTHNELQLPLPQQLNTDMMEGQIIKSDIIQISHDEIQPLLQAPSDLTSGIKEPLIINFQEYVIKIRQILHQSKIYFTHSEVNDKNIVSKIDEILQDDFASKKVRNMNKSLQILADLNQHQKHQFLDVYSKINEATIAYVGDGNNDALALRAAHVGYTLGKTATNVAKECSGVILMDDYLEGIELSIKWGRNIFLNIKRFIYFQLSFFLTSITLMLTASIFFKQQPFSVLEVIWLSLVQDIFSAIALSTEVPQKSILKKTKPARRGENLIDKYLLQMTVSQAAFQYFTTVTVLFLAPTIFDIEPSYNHEVYEIGAEFNSEWVVHYTIVYHLTAMFQVVNLLNSRRIGHGEYNVLKGIKKNKPFLVMILALIIVEQIIVYFGDNYFKTASLTIWQNVFCLVLSIGSLLMFWVAKSMFSEKPKK